MAVGAAAVNNAFPAIHYKSGTAARLYKASPGFPLLSGSSRCVVLFFKLPFY